MARRDPLKAVQLGHLAVGGATRIPVCKRRELPVWVLLVAAEDGRSPCRLERMRHARDRLQGERNELRRLAQETRDGLRHDALFLSARASLNEHLQVELLAGEPLQGVLADGAELA